MGKYTKNQRRTLWVSLVTSFITTFMGSSLNLSIPDMERFFGISTAQAGWIVTAYMLTCAALAVPLGYIADRGCRKKILAAGIVIFGAACGGAAFSRAMWMMLSFRVLQGIGASMIFCTNIAVLTAAFDEGQRGKILGWAACANYSGLSAGPVLGGLINNFFGWQGIFIVGAVITSAALPAAFTGRREEEIMPAGKADVKGCILFAAAVILFMYGLNSDTGFLKKGYIIAAGVILFIIFVKKQKASDDPVLDIHSLKSSRAYIAAFINYGAVYGFTYMFSLYLRSVMGFTAGVSGLILAANTVVLSVLSVFAGRAADKYRPELLSATGMTICASAMGLVWVKSDALTLPFIILVLAVCGVGASLFSAPNTKKVMSEVSKEEYSRVSALLSSVRSAGHTAVMAVITASITVYAGKEGLEAAPEGNVVSVLNTVFLILTAACILGIFMAIKRKV